MRIQKTLIFLACLVMLTSAAWGLSSQTGKMQSSGQALITDTDTYLDINSLLCFVYNDGNYAYDNATLLGKTDGLYFPRGTKKTVIYSAGIWVGAKVDDEVRVVVAEYGSEFVPGPMEDGTYLPDDPSFRVYKIDRSSNLPTSDYYEDYTEWPSEYGAPVDDDGNPSIIGDQMCWAVYNDADPSGHTNSAGLSDPLGLEIQQTTFAYGRTGALGQVIFVKYLIINEGGNTLEDTYISLWADPDLGGASDDLVGCDTVLSLGYCYNDAGADNTYGSSPPAVGFDFFQGPLVDGEATDSGKFLGEWYQGKKNLPMSSFNKYINGTDPHSPLESYNYMQGLTIDGEPLVDPTTSEITTFMVPGDPVTSTGWLDNASADRRFMMTTGPFTMNPGDSQEVVAAIVVGQGSNRLSSITELKTVDAQAQIVFDLNFDIPSPPPNPIVWARAYDGAIDLVWTPADVDSNYPEQHYQDYIDKLGEFYIFEGYNIYQGESQSGPWTKVATYDYSADESYHFFGELAGDYYITCTGEDEEMVCDSVERPWDYQMLYEDAVNTSKGGIETTITQAGTESGLINHLYIESSYLDGAPIVNNRPYYFAVTPFSVNIQQVGSKDSVWSGETFLGFKAASLENIISSVEVVPLSSGATLIDTAVHTSGPSQGYVTVEYLSYTNETAEDYEVTFNEDGTWDLTREGLSILVNQDNQSGDYTYSLVDGLMIRVMGPDAGIAPGANSASGGIIETVAVDVSGNTYTPTRVYDNVFWSYNDADAQAAYYVSSDVSGSSDAARARFNWRGLMEWESWEFRFTESGSEYFDWNDDSKFGDKAPFEIWHFNENETEPDRRDFFFILDDDESGGWSTGDRIYVTEHEYGTEPLPEPPDYDWPAEFHLGRVLINDETPATGTVFRFNSTVPNGTADVYNFTTKPVGSDDGTVVGLSLDDVLVIPNPYYNYNILETDQFDRVVKFVNLPPARCTIKIFNIAGDLVRELEKENLADAELVWDVKTTRGLYVASGIYVYYIEADGIGDTFGKLIVFTEVEQLKTY